MNLVRVIYRHYTLPHALKYIISQSCRNWLDEENVFEWDIPVLKHGYSDIQFLYVSLMFSVVLTQKEHYYFDPI